MRLGVIAFSAEPPRRFAAILAGGLLASTWAFGADAQKSAGLSTETPAPTESSVRLGEMAALVPVQGSVVARDLYRLKSTIEGRTEAVLPSTGIWVHANAPLGFMVDRDLAAIIDQTTTPVDITEERWQRMYQPNPIRFAHDCYVLRKFIQNKKHVRPNAFLFEVARSLKLVGTVAAKDCHSLKEGALVRAWPWGAASRAIEARLDRWNETPNAKEGCAIEAALSEDAYLPANTLWEGHIEIPVIKRTLSVPNGALLQFHGASYLPVRVSTGVAVGGETEILSGVEANRNILILHPAAAIQPARVLPSSPPVPLKAKARENQCVHNITATQQQALPLSIREPHPPSATDHKNTPDEVQPQDASPNAIQEEMEPNPRDLPPGDDR